MELTQSSSVPLGSLFSISLVAEPAEKRYVFVSSTAQVEVGPFELRASITGDEQQARQRLRACKVTAKGFKTGRIKSARRKNVSQTTQINAAWKEFPLKEAGKEKYFPVTDTEKTFEVSFTLTTDGRSQGEAVVFVFIVSCVEPPMEQVMVHSTQYYFLTRPSSQSTPATIITDWQVLVTTHGQKNLVPWVIVKEKIRSMFHTPLRDGADTPQRPLTEADLEQMLSFVGGTTEPWLTEEQFTTLFTWFHGCREIIHNYPSLWENGLIAPLLSTPDVERILKSYEPGVFVLRFSYTHPGCLVVSVMNKQRAIDHVLLQERELVPTALFHHLANYSLFATFVQFDAVRGTPTGTVAKREFCGKPVSRIGNYVTLSFMRLSNTEPALPRMSASTASSAQPLRGSANFITAAPKDANSLKLSCTRQSQWRIEGNTVGVLSKSSVAP